jgi:tRNA pseudouridine38-40 synthase
MPRTLKLVVAYDGTPFVGWQRQAEGVSVQGLLEEALARIEGRGVTVTGAGRTDAGVHALAQVASCAIDHPIPAADLRRALNAMLPPEVRVATVEETSAAFHARYSARGKTYRYAILNGDAASPFFHRYAWHVSQPLAVEQMATAARLLEGTHDFAAFQSAGSAVQTTVRTVFSSTVAEADPRHPPVAWPEADPGGRVILYQVSGDGFLRHMVRAIVGSLVEVGTKRREPSWIGRLLDGGSRDAAGPTAPAHGLWLVKVDYLPDL